MTEEVRVVLRVDHRVNNLERDCLAVLGSAHELGCWKPDKAVKAEYMGRSTWQAVVKLPANQTSVWKWVVLDKTTNEIIQWESGIDKTIEIQGNPLMGVSEWGKPVVMADISTESCSRIFEGVKDISSENLHVNHRTQDMPQARKKSVERKGRVIGKKVKRVNSKGKLVEDNVAKVKSKKPQKSLNTMAKIAVIQDLAVFADTCQSSPTDSALTNNNFLNAESTVKLKGGKGLKGLFQKVLRSQSQKSRAQDKCSGKSRPMTSDVNENSVLKLQSSCVTDDVPDWNRTDASVASFASMTCGNAHTLEFEKINVEDDKKSPNLSKTSAYDGFDLLLTCGETNTVEGKKLNFKGAETSTNLAKPLSLNGCGLSSMENVKICQKVPSQETVNTAGNDLEGRRIVSSTETEYEDRFSESRRHMVEQKETRASINTKLFTPELVDDKPDNEENTNVFVCDKMYSSTCREPSMLTDNSISVPTEDIDFALSQTKQNAKLKEKTYNFAFDEINGHNTEKEIAPTMPTDMCTMSEFDEQPFDEIHVSSNKNVTALENTTALIEMYKAKDSDMLSSLSDPQLPLEKKTERLNSKSMLIVAKNTQILKQTNANLDNPCSAFNRKNHVLELNARDNNFGCKSLNTNFDVSDKGSTAKISLGTGADISNQSELKGLENVDTRTLGTYSQANFYDGATNLNTEFRDCKVRRDSTLRYPVAEKEWPKSNMSNKPSLEENECIESEYCTINTNLASIHERKSNSFSKPQSKGFTSINSPNKKSSHETLYNGLVGAVDDEKNCPTHKKSVTPDSVALSRETITYDKEPNKLQMKVYGDCNDDKVASSLQDLTVQQCKEMKLVTKQLHEKTKHEDVENNLTFSKQTMSPNFSVKKNAVDDTGAFNNDVVDTFRQQHFDDKAEKYVVIKTPIEDYTALLTHETSAAKNNNILKEGCVPVDSEKRSSKYRTNPTSVHYLENKGVSVSNDTTKRKNETLKECGLADMVSYPIESIVNLAKAQHLNDVIAQDGAATSKTTATCGNEMHTDIVENLNNLSNCTADNIMSLKSVYEKNIDIVEECPSSAKALLNENLMVGRNTESNKKVPRVNFSHLDVNFSHDTRWRGFVQHAENVHDVNSVTQQTVVSNRKDNFLDLVEKYKVPIGMSVAAACAAIFIMKKN